MIEYALEVMSVFILDVIGAWGYWGVFILMAMDNVNIPLPSELILPFAGFLVSTGTFSLWPVILVGTLGSLTGSWISYYIATHFEKWTTDRVTHHQKYETVKRWFHKYGSHTVFWSRMIPLVRTFISLPAGMFRINFTKFTIYTFLGSFIWSTILTYPGYLLGENWHDIEPYMRQFDTLIAGIIGAGIAISLVFHFKRKNGKNISSKLEA